MTTSPTFPGFVGKYTPCVGDACLWYQVGCYNGCPECSCMNKEMYPTPEDDAKCTTATEPTLPARARTWNREGKSPINRDFTKYNPWRSPGHAPVRNACGVASGFVPGWSGAEMPMGEVISTGSARRIASRPRPASNKCHSSLSATRP